MNTEGSVEGRDEPTKVRSLPQHPLVTRLKQEVGQPAQRLTLLIGLPGDSDQEGIQRLYLNQQLDYYAQFKLVDMLRTEPVPVDQSPFPDVEATRVFIAPDAIIQYTWVRSSQPVDQFNLDTRLGGVPPLTAVFLDSKAVEENVEIRKSDECLQGAQFQLMWVRVPQR
jgi:hypothetical protein